MAEQSTRRGSTLAQGYYLRTEPVVMPQIEVETTRATIGCVIPAYNEGETIGAVLDSLLGQTVVPDVVHVVVNNTTDHTVEVASHFAGPHLREINGRVHETEVFVHDIGENPDKKVGALNYGFEMVRGMDYFLGVDGDTTAEPDAVEHLLEEIESDRRIGGISAIYSIDDTDLTSWTSKFLIAGQRQQFATFNMQNLLRGRQMAVLGGQFSIFRMTSLYEVTVDNHQGTPWVRDSEIEDSLLSLQIRSAGYLTKISATARANVGGMPTFAALDAQQVKWNAGAIDLMWPGQRGDTKGQPFHPNLRLRWFEMMSMVLNMYTRLTFVSLVICSLLISAWVFNPLWLVPPLISTALNLRVARSMTDRGPRDTLFALLWLPSEAYIWTRMGHFVRAWTKFAFTSENDNWAAQARAESGQGKSAFLAPFGAALVLIATMVIVFLQLPEGVQPQFLYVNWTVLAIVTILQSAWLFLKCVRRYRGFKV
ncbi:cellulose synthase/poly-beta-1,6-N-acetylglucosamine synthase-like glycosyltransferase [Nocardioides daedukensis]|uniref:Cellulose synthase/poly-beta-1,6-N-acetylglucosamine synthase-like glycosyltransferase n=1 Tax=Nocardioides daedukensis TaxID=634462 RepID=A0A7Y9S4B4_9ACTN|nr:glycosyltransferase family 2 protein [Nocardioides daedukensis]NYG59778.1 cellulose synthase/poly-beta-1,6-N-acetylglucosamine synthase-like glycosyltransferase [Nocardioides daedukensis]